MKLSLSGATRGAVVSDPNPESGSTPPVWAPLHRSEPPAVSPCSIGMRACMDRSDPFSPEGCPRFGWDFLFFSGRRYEGVRVCGQTRLLRIARFQPAALLTMQMGSWPVYVLTPRRCMRSPSPGAGGHTFISALGSCTDNPYDGQGVGCFEEGAQGSEAACVAAGRLCQWNEAAAGPCDEIGGCPEGLSQ